MKENKCSSFFVEERKKRQKRKKLHTLFRILVFANISLVLVYALIWSNILITHENRTVFQIDVNDWFRLSRYGGVKFPIKCDEKM